MEYWDILDCNRVKTGRLVKRGDPMSPDDYHLVVHVWIRNSNGEFLISKRTMNKTFPGMWETTGGSAVAGDGSLKTALKETNEEIGLKLNANNGILLYQFRRRKNDFSDFLDVWLFIIEKIEISKLLFQKDEVSDAMWATKSEIRALIADGRFVNEFTYLNNLFEKY